ncbi:O-antigen ligase family protein [Nodosilinea sp. P-1105]|uniref:O-antigen ligase family protein n=1 Tax=Nodosilinea sp. P-1105 TaxID=2546229 RepID=UPI00146B4F15|nr:O-antigen ligase family protein [Nodosilinea sp. P-1105]NMF83036.1 O-antigen ligase family protein [Nodosilinea sp. P-1105]
MINFLRFTDLTLSKSQNKLSNLICFFLGYYTAPKLPAGWYSAWAAICYIILTFLVYKRRANFLYIASKDWIIISLVGLAILSGFWSTDAGVTLRYSRALVASTAFGIYLSSVFKFEKQTRILLNFFALIIVINLLFPIFIPFYRASITHFGYFAWVGIQRHKNELSGAMSLATSLLLTFGLFGETLAIRRRALFFAFLGFLLLWLSEGKGSLAVFCGSLVLLPLYKIVCQKHKESILLLTIFIYLCISVAVATILSMEFIIVDLLGKSLELNSRTPLWELLIERGMTRPLGFGYGGFWINLEEAKIVADQFHWIGGVGEGGGNAHNGYVELFLQLGFPGVILLGIHVVSTVIRVVFLFAREKKIEYLCMLQFLVVMIVTNYYESYSAFLSYRNWFWVLYVAISYSSIMAIKNLAKPKTIPQPELYLMDKFDQTSKNPWLY